MVDILLAAYNGEKYIGQQIKSILNQSCSDFRLLISDDCSTDKTRQIISDYEKKDSRIKVFFQEQNLGYVKNFEFLLKKSDAEYIMFSDQDDYWYPQKIKKMLEYLMSRDADLVYCDMHQIDGSSKIINESYIRSKDFPVYEGKGSLLPAVRHFATGCSQLFTKRVKDYILPFLKEVTAHDWVSVYAASRLKGVCFIDERLMGYRLHDENVFGGKSTKTNLNEAKAKFGKSFAGYLEYRKSFIDITYLKGINMALAYNDEPELISAKKYFEALKKNKIISFKFGSYFKYIFLPHNLKRSLKEFIITKLVLLGYLIYLI